MHKYILAILLLAISLNLKAEESLQDCYLLCYVRLHDAESLEKSQDYLNALVYFKVVLAVLQTMHNTNASWEPALVNKRLKDSQDVITRLQPLAAEQYLAPMKSSVPIGFSPSPYTVYADALHLKEIHHYWEALTQFELCLTTLQIIHGAGPKPDPKPEQTMIDSQKQIDDLLKLIVPGTK